VRGLSDILREAGGSAADVAGSLRDAAAPRDADGAAIDVAGSLRETLAEAVEHHGSKLVLLCSFQKEESVLIDELLRIGNGATDVHVATIDTGVLFEETMHTWRAFEEHFGISVEVHDASNPSAPWTGPEHCCSAAKVAALERALDGMDGWITGIRREQSSTRADAQLVELDAKHNPLALWTERDLWRRIHERELPYHPLHDQGYSSIGCAPCTSPGDGRSGRWAGTAKTECGLHV
jgi:phosphoadenosine phosphosulfate reductase